MYYFFTSIGHIRLVGYYYFFKTFRAIDVVFKFFRTSINSIKSVRFEIERRHQFVSRRALKAIITTELFSGKQKQSGKSIQKFVLKYFLKSSITYILLGTKTLRYNVNTLEDFIPVPVSPSHPPPQFRSLATATRTGRTKTAPGHRGSGGVANNIVTPHVWHDNRVRREIQCTGQHRFPVKCGRV